MKFSRQDEDLVKTERETLLPKLDYSFCGFSSVDGDTIAVFAVYLDESGTHSDRVTVVAGYVADVKKWTAFSAEWQGFLHDRHIPFFHMKDFCSDGSSLCGRLSDSQREEVVRKLTEGIRETVTFGVAAAIRPHEYNRLTTDKFRSRHGSSYTACVLTCVEMALKFLPELKSTSGQVGVFLERGHKNAQQAEKMLNEYAKRNEPVDSQVKTLILNALGEWPAGRVTAGEAFREVGYKIGTVGQGTKRGMLPLQAADLLAYCYHAQATQKKEHLCTEAFDAVIEDIHHYLYVIETAQIQQAIAEDVRAESMKQESWRESRSLTQYLRSAGIEAYSVWDGVNAKGDSNKLLQLGAQWKATKK
jgi:hypothetical protein